MNGDQKHPRQHELSESGRIEEKDKKFLSGISDSKYENRQFIRLVAIDLAFKNVSFRYSTFDACYIRNCRFEKCNFTGVRFVGSNLIGTRFESCNFEYAAFERTVVDIGLLRDNAPGHENLELRFARSLRVNFQQLGDAVSANEAIRAELSATRVHLKKAWSSKSGILSQQVHGKVPGVCLVPVGYLRGLAFRMGKWRECVEADSIRGLATPIGGVH
jgi:hypothetical protein